MKRLFLVILLLAAPAWAVGELDLDLCGAQASGFHEPSDGYTDGNGCIVIPDGGSSLTFTHSYLIDEPSTADATVGGVPQFEIDNDSCANPDTDEACSLLIQFSGDGRIDNYLGNGAKGKDGLRIGSLAVWKYILVEGTEPPDGNGRPVAGIGNLWTCGKDTHADPGACSAACGNNPTCINSSAACCNATHLENCSEKTTEEWDGPGDLFCPVDAISGAHKDIVQIVDQPNFAGQITWANLKMVNGNFSRIQGSPLGDDGRANFIGVQIGQDPDFGLADDAVADCISQNSGVLNQTALAENCAKGIEWRAGQTVNEVWLVDSDLSESDLGFTCPASDGCTKLVVIDTGTVNYASSGYPRVVASNGSADNPNQCTGLVDDDNGRNVYCYGSYQAALAANPSWTLPMGAYRHSQGFDADGDGVLDAEDNCVNVANAGTLQCDTDGDGYGNRCDGDFSQNELVTAGDFGTYFQPDFSNGKDGGTGTDMECNGSVTAGDFTLFQTQLTAGKPGPSGLACAGTVPCDL